MLKSLMAGAALSLVATTVVANTNYPVEVTRDGVLYNCEAGTFIHNGKEARRCVTVGGVGEGGAGPTTPIITATPVAAGGGGLFGGGGLGTGGAIALGVLGAAALAAAIDNSNDSTNGTGDEED